MANFILDNTYFVLDSSASPLDWPTGARIQNVLFFASGTNASASFILGAGSPILNFNLIGASSGFGASLLPNPFSVDYHGVGFKTAWIPTSLIACSAWISFI